MKYDTCTDCGKEKTGKQLWCARCRSCSSKLKTLGKTASPETRAKLSVVHKGKTRSPEHRANMSLARGGDGVTFLNRKYPGLTSWAHRNKEKTPYCQWCYSEDKLEAHHIMPKSKFPQYSIDDDNCRIMCQSCHKTCHKQGGF